MCSLNKFLEIIALSHLTHPAQWVLQLAQSSNMFGGSIHLTEPIE